MQKYGSKNKKVYPKSYIFTMPPPPVIVAPPISQIPERPLLPVCVPPPQAPNKPIAWPISRRNKAPPPPPPVAPAGSHDASRGIVLTPIPMAPVVVKSIRKPVRMPEPVVVPKLIVEPVPVPEPPTGSRAWKIHQFIKANFKC